MKSVVDLSLLKSMLFLEYIFIGMEKPRKKVPMLDVHPKVKKCKKA